MEQNPLCIAFASQKGGVGKSTLTVLAASWLHYLHGIRVAVVDCDYPQHSILKLSNRDKAVVQSSAIYGRLLVSLAENKGVKPYRILCCKPSEAMSEWRKWAAVAEERYDVVLFDLPGTVGNEGVLSTIVELDYLFIPMKADRICGAVRQYRPRERPYPAAASRSGRDCRDSRIFGNPRTLSHAVTVREASVTGHASRSRPDVDRRQGVVPAYAFRSGRPPRQRSYG